MEIVGVKSLMLRLSTQEPVFGKIIKKENEFITIDVDGKKEHEELHLSNNIFISIEDVEKIISIERREALIEGQQLELSMQIESAKGRINYLEVLKMLKPTNGCPLNLGPNCCKVQKPETKSDG